jgi:DNA-binding NarL/FixJ family response regulator
MVKPSVLSISYPSHSPDDALTEKESLIEYNRTKADFSDYLGKDRKVRMLVDQLADGCSKNAEIASALKVWPRTVKNLLRRLIRKWSSFRPRCAKSAD